MKAIVINFDFDNDIQQLLNAYDEKINYYKFMIEKLKENSYKSDNTKEIMEYSLELIDLENALKRLENI